MEKQSGALGYPDLAWWWGVVEDRMDPKKRGRVKVRIYGYYSGNPGKMPVDALPWALVLQGITSAAASGVGSSPTGIVEGTTVWGVFLDGANAQSPMVIGTIAGAPTGQGFDGGFKDPNGKYPRSPGENDVNRLARNEQIGDTVIQKKRDGVATASVAFGGTWTEPATKYAAKYPYNHVRESESGHVFEVDDTEGKERISQWHRKGTFVEIDPEGTQVEKVVKDNYRIVLGNDYVKVSGNVKVFIEGNSSVLVNGNADIEVNGNCKETIHGNYTLKVDGNMETTVGGVASEKAGVHIKKNAPRIDLN
ncbi:baseplate hub subunit and tail lysozyme [Acidovorax phage ACP17]|uniref:Baseplate hub subunit/tail lysozyme n=1 Tax=Acidovorax phage ACP17 TaxID=2010329 RepID=A0A223AIX6_9CAUD|nr:baseplate hub subunit and tail lysozyme [Acidovorax phage ACP17]ASS33917.1 baseplate hub subunit/tail lysozyme [Acidovorax phage ACP17]